MEQRVERLNKAEKLFKERLGLEIRKTSGKTSVYNRITSDDNLNLTFSRAKPISRLPCFYASLLALCLLSESERKWKECSISLAKLG